jgi:hypothetical protein
MSAWLDSVDRLRQKSTTGRHASTPHSGVGFGSWPSKMMKLRPVTPPASGFIA